MSNSSRDCLVPVKWSALVVLLAAVVVTGTPAEAAGFSFAWGSSGAGDGQFSGPGGTEIDASGTVVYVVDTGNNRVQKFTTDGAFLAKWGSFGSGNGQFFFPRDVDFDDGQNVYVTDTANCRIQKFTASGVFLAKWGTCGSGNGQFSNSPRDIALDASNNVYVIDTGNNRVQKFTSTGAFLAKWGSLGSANGQFNFNTDLSGLEIDAAGNVYVGDSGNCRVQKFTSTGVFLTKWGTCGSGNGQFSSPAGPMGIGIDSFGNTYVSDSGNCRVQKFTPSGVFLAKWGTCGSGNGQFTSAPRGITVNVRALSNIYVSDTGNDRVEAFLPVSCTDIDANGTSDNDGDSLCDNWERDGIDLDEDGVADVQLWDVNGDGHIDAGEKAHPNVPDVYIEVDWMVGHTPNWDALNQVVESFRHSPTNSPRTLPSVRLHIQRGDQALLHSSALAWASLGISGPEPDFSTVKNFGTQVERAKPNWSAVREAKRMVFHYALFVHSLSGTSTSGVGELRGNDLVVSLGGWTNNDAAPPSPDKQAGTFMHEVGHNLGLLHGGGDGSGCKPNYLSVMNYTRQFDNVYVNNRPLDYSDRSLPSLSEVNIGTPPNIGLNEPGGIGGSNGDRTAFGPPHCRVSGVLCEYFWQCPLLLEPCGTETNVDARGAINWNRDSDSIDAGVTEDINFIPSASCCPERDADDHCLPGFASEVLYGHDDWGNLNFDFRSGLFYPDSGSGSALQVAAQASPPEEWDAADAAWGPDDDGDAVANVFDNCILIANPDQADDDGDGSGNVGDCSPSDPSVYPSAPEINDGRDNQCPGDPGYGLVDEILIAHYEDSAKTAYSWYTQEGATLYEVARSSRRDFSACTLGSTVQSYLDDPEVPAEGGVFYYLARARAPNAGTWGSVSSGGQRVVACGP